MFKIETGPLQRSVTGILFGPPGVGKTEFASNFKRSVILDMENGSDFLNVSRIKIKSFEDVISALTWIGKEDNIDTVILDSITALEGLGVAYTCAVNAWPTIEKPGYGKGWATYRAHMGRIVKAIDYLESKGKNLLFVGHSLVTKVNDPSQDSYDRVEYHMDQKLMPILTSKIDFCFYMRPQVRVADKDDKEKRTLSNGTRELITFDKGGTLSKNRFPHLPEIVEFHLEKDPTARKKMYADFWDTMLNFPV